MKKYDSGFLQPSVYLVLKHPGESGFREILHFTELNNTQRDIVGKSLGMAPE
jgi:hypothetical protein